jgi:predicted RND superfamily exporter protein
MKKELGETTSQIKKLENKNNTEWSSLDLVQGKSIGELKKHENELAQEISKIQKEIKKSRSKTLLIAELSVLPVLFLLIMVSGMINVITDFAPQQSTVMKTRYFTENLKGDTVDTWKSWRLVGTTLNINILKSPRVTEHQIDIIKNAITSEKIIELDDSIVHKGPKGSTSTYFEGWEGAMKSASNRQTKYNLPDNLNFIDGSGGEGDIIITLSNIKDSDGYTGYTKSVTEENEILKSFITIYDISELSDLQLATIVRHEFGHALGLGHSTATEDLMAPTIDMTIPYISECNVDAIVDLYNGNENKRTVCAK